MINYDLRKIRALVFDVDGVLSAETIQMNNDGVLMRSLNTKDGYALRLAVTEGLHVAIITGARDEVERRSSAGRDIVGEFVCISVKADSIQKLLDAYELSPDEVLYMGDDIPDYEVMQMAGLPCCPRDAAPEIRDISTYISHIDGGQGCARDVIEQVLKAQGKWMANKEAFSW